MTQQNEWLGQVVEEIIEPDRPIVDPHHHLWRHRETPYLLEDLWGDTGSGHNIEQTVFVECAAEYRTDGPPELMPVGETEFVAEVAATSAQGPEGSARIGAIVSHADMLLGEASGAVLDAHIEAGNGLFRGIRHAGGFDDSDVVRNSHSNPSKDLYERPAFHAGLRELANRGLTFDAWNYHHQIPALTSMARAVPEVTIIFDHFGGPLGIGPYEGKRDEIFAQWKKDVTDLASCPNVFPKIGGLAMPINGFDWHKQDKPATSDEFVTAQRDYYLHMIDVFEPNRCMFESNFPVDKQSISYPVLWNGLKKMAAGFSEDEKEDLFRGTASRVYKIAPLT